MRAKMRCVEVTKSEGGTRVKLQPVTSGCPENQEFFKYTPTGLLELGVISEVNTTKFEPGKEFYIDFTEA